MPQARFSGHEYRNAGKPITQDNIATLERYGFTVIPSESGVLACKDVGSGRLPKEDVLISISCMPLPGPKILPGLRIAVTAGPHADRWTRCATSPTIPPARWAMPLPVRRHARRGCHHIHGETALQPVKFTTDVP